MSEIVYETEYTCPECGDTIYYDEIKDKYYCDGCDIEDDEIREMRGIGSDEEEDIVPGAVITNEGIEGYVVEGSMYDV